MDLSDEMNSEGNFNEPVQKVLHVSHIIQKILEYTIEDFRKKLFVVGTRSRQGDLRGFLNLRLVSRQMNNEVRLVLRRELKSITIDIDDYFIRLNNFVIAPHKKPARGQRQQQAPVGADGQQDNDNDSDEDEDDDDVQGPRNENGRVFDDDEQGVDPLASEDVADVDFLKRFLAWLQRTYDPAVERFKIFDSWSFKPCSLPIEWVDRLYSFESMHPDMEYCDCAQCINTIKNSRTFFGPLSFKMAEDAIKEQKISYGTLSLTDAFLADLANQYSFTDRNTSVFDSEKLIKDYGGIRCNEVFLALQTLSPYRDDEPLGQPLEIIQFLIKHWQVKTIHFEVVKYLDNQYYSSRRSWETSGAFNIAYFASYKPDDFDVSRHISPYKTCGLLDKDAQHEDFLPVFDLRLDCTDANRMGSDLSLNSRYSDNFNRDSVFEWIHQGRLAFNMFRTDRLLFIESGILEFRGDIGTCNWLKYTTRTLMRSTWGRQKDCHGETGKTVYWIMFMEDVAPECFGRIWNNHMEDLYKANFPGHIITMHTSDAFQKNKNRTIAKYCDTKRADVTKFSKTYYVTFYEPRQNNTTHFKFVALVS